MILECIIIKLFFIVWDFNRKVLKEKSLDLFGKVGLISCYYGVFRGLGVIMRGEKRRGLEGCWKKRLKTVREICFIFGFVCGLIFFWLIEILFWRWLGMFVLNFYLLFSSFKEKYINWILKRLEIFWKCLYIELVLVLGLL